MIKAFALGVLGCASVVSLGCQTYDFEPVEPLSIAQQTQERTVEARSLKPNVLLMVDTSGSMLEPIDGSAAACRVGGEACGPSEGQSPCPDACPTRLSDMKSAMGNFLTNSGTVARMGMVYYPRDSTCAAATASGVDVKNLPPSDMDDDATTRAKADEINSVIQALRAQGGTPTGNSLQAMGSYAGFGEPDRKDFILLLTDGLPNCNRANTNYQMEACACTTAPVSGVDQCAPGAPLEAQGCLDRDATVAAIRALRQIDIRTIVVGFGAELASGDGPNTLQAMAVAGDFAPSYYKAATGSELAAELAKIAGGLDETACVTTLNETPTDPAYLTVIVDGDPVQRGDNTWNYSLVRRQSDGVEVPTVTFVGALCDRLLASTKEKPVQLDFRIVQTL